jgi:A/G-specific adenine glycosylase
MLVLAHGDEVLLEKRAPTGVWARLWCFPEAESMAGALDLAAHFGTVQEAVRLAKIAHAFTHYALDIHPVVARLKSRAAMTGETPVRWMPVARAHRGAVPAPVRRILEALVDIVPAIDPQGAAPVPVVS